jgi:hypothetical protein
MFRCCQLNLMFHYYQQSLMFLKNHLYWPHHLHR